MTYIAERISINFKYVGFPKGVLSQSVRVVTDRRATFKKVCMFREGALKLSTCLRGIRQGVE